MKDTDAGAVRLSVRLSCSAVHPGFCKGQGHTKLGELLPIIFHKSYAS